MLSKIWFYIISFSVVFSIFSGNLDKVGSAFLEGAKESVSISISFLGVCSFFLGIMEIMKKANLVEKISDFIMPIMEKLFKENKNNKDVMNAITMNLSANFLGIGNAATPFGIEAMRQINLTKPKKDTLSNDMIMFIILNTTSVQLIPTSIIGYRLLYGSHNPGVVFIPILIATSISSVCGILITKFFIKVEGKC